MTERFRCSANALTADEPLHATASVVRRWILLEQPGPWGGDALSQSRLPQSTAAELAQRARRLGARVVLIRRYGRQTADGCAAFVASTAPAGCWVESFQFDKPAELLDVNLEPLRDGRRVGGLDRDEPLHLVCTNGKHDVCCAEQGRPLASALTRARPEQTWECSHIGGDRFAGNIVTFPHGLYFGRVGPEDGVRITARYDGGLLDLHHFRGRCTYPFAIQAAEHFVRLAQGLEHVDALRLRRAQLLSEGAWEARFDLAGGAAVARVAVRGDAGPRLLTCSSPGPLTPPRYELLDLDVSPA